MNSFTRMIPYIWPFRKKIFLSALFALFVAMLWGLNISAVFPLVSVLLDDKSIQEYVDDKIVAAHEDTKHHGARLARLDERLQKSKRAGAGDSSPELVEIHVDRAREQNDLSSASNKLLVLNWIKSYVLPYVPRDRFDTLALILGIVLFATVLKGVCIFVQDVMIGNVVELTTMSLRKACFRKALELDYQTLSLEGTSDLMSRFTYDTTVLANGLSLLGGKVIREPLKAAACVVLAFYVNWRLTLLSFVFAPLAAILFFRIGKLLKRASKRLMESMSKIYKTLEETFDSAKVVIAFDGARRHRVRFHRESKEYFKKAMKIVRIDALTSPTTEVLGLFAAFVALLPGAYLVLRGTNSIWGIQLTAGPMDIEQLSLLYALLIGVSDPVRKLSSVYAKLKRSGAAADRIFELMDRETRVLPARNPQPLPRLARQVEFQNVSFRYATKDPTEERRPEALKGITLTVKAGEVIAVVGENGSGKSTLVNLLPRFYDPDHGAVCIDGLDVREADLRDLRGQIGVVTQETLLFDATIAENIRYGRSTATDEDVELAARHAHVLQFAEQLPEGLRTQIGGKGGRLSGGQRQRIAMARALLRDPAILILDEATSAIDAHSEFLIHKTLREYAAGRTTFIITHSVSQSILDFVSRIVVMEQGELLACGPHESLMQSCPAYVGLFQAQTQQRSA